MEGESSGKAITLSIFFCYHTLTIFSVVLDIFTLSLHGFPTSFPNQQYEKYIQLGPKDALFEMPLAVCQQTESECPLPGHHARTMRQPLRHVNMSPILCVCLF